MLFSKDGRYIIVSTGGRLRSPDPPEGDTYLFKEGKFLWKKHTLGTVHLSADGNLIAISKYRDFDEEEGEWVEDTTLFYDREGGEILKDKKIIGVDEISRDGNYFVASYNWITGFYDEVKDWTYKKDILHQEVKPLKELHKETGPHEKTALYDKNGNLLWEIDKAGSVSISADGTYVAVGVGNKVYLYNREGVLLWRQNIETELGIFVKLSANGEYLVAAPDFFQGEGTIYFFNQQGTLLQTFKVDRTDRGFLESLALSDDDSYIVALYHMEQTGHRSSLLYFFHKSGKLLWQMNNCDNFSMSYDGSYIGVRTKDKFSLLDNSAITSTNR